MIFRKNKISLVFALSISGKSLSQEQKQEILALIKAELGFIEITYNNLNAQYAVNLQTIQTTQRNIQEIKHELAQLQKQSKIQQAFYIAGSSLIVILGVFLVWKCLLQPKKKALDLSSDVKNLIKEGDALEKKYKTK